MKLLFKWSGSLLSYSWIVSNYRDCEYYHTPSGNCRFLKLSIKFDEWIQFEARIPLEDCYRPDATAIVDFELDYFIGKITHRDK